MLRFADPIIETVESVLEGDGVISIRRVESKPDLIDEPETVGSDEVGNADRRGCGDVINKAGESAPSGSGVEGNEGGLM